MSLNLKVVSKKETIKWVSNKNVLEAYFYGKLKLTITEDFRIVFRNSIATKPYRDQQSAKVAAEKLIN